MIRLLPAGDVDVAIGNSAGWMLTFHEESGETPGDPFLTLSSERLNGEIQATLPRALEGGSYSFTLEGVGDDDYAALARKRAAAPVVVQLYLFWRDANASVAGYLANLAGLGDLMPDASATALRSSCVAVLTVTRLSRALGRRGHETKIEAAERVHYQLASARLGEAVKAKNLKDAATQLAQKRSVPIQTHGFGPDGSLPAPAGANPGTERKTLEKGLTFRVAMEQVAADVERATGKYGRGMLLIRLGKLHLGERKFPLEQPKKTLDSRSGLIEVVPQNAVESDPGYDLDAPGRTAAPARRQFKLVLKGRPDLRPGDVVEFDLPREEVAPESVPGLSLAAPFVPSLGLEGLENPATAYVSSVEHRLGRTTGFSTTVAAVEVNPDSAWDVYTPSGSDPAPAQRQAPAGAGAALGDAVRRLVREVLSEVRRADVGEIREATTDPQTAEPPPQTMTVWRGLLPADGRDNGARRLDVERKKPTPLEGVAYTTPFAWSNCGLVLPRYPGARVMLAHRNGQAGDPVELGCLWETGAAPRSKDGDWWLILPTEVKKRATFADADKPPVYKGNAADDLIDADGNRVIEVGELTIRVGKKALNQAGSRPERTKTAESVTIEHADGKASLVIKAGGAVEITGETISLTANQGDLKLAAPNGNVDVAVSGAMKVH